MDDAAQGTAVDCETQLEHAKERIEQVEERVEKAQTRAELAETRMELAETRTELAQARAALAEARAAHVETALQRVVTNAPQQGDGAGQPLETGSSTGGSDKVSPLDHLNSRQREILQLIAEGKNTKVIAEILNLSPKTVEYHRARLMQAVDVHDIPGLVRLAVSAGLVPAKAEVD